MYWFTDKTKFANLNLITTDSLNLITTKSLNITTLTAAKAPDNSTGLPQRLGLQSVEEQRVDWISTTEETGLPQHLVPSERDDRRGDDPRRDRPEWRRPEKRQPERRQTQRRSSFAPPERKTELKDEVINKRKIKDEEMKMRKRKQMIKRSADLRNKKERQGKNIKMQKVLSIRSILIDG